LVQYSGSTFSLHRDKSGCSQLLLPSLEFERTSISTKKKSHFMTHCDHIHCKWYEWISTMYTIRYVGKICKPPCFSCMPSSGFLHCLVKTIRDRKNQWAQKLQKKKNIFRKPHKSHHENKHMQASSIQPKWHASWIKTQKMKLTRCAIQVG
jgi:hypothetical protein